MTNTQIIFLSIIIIISLDYLLERWLDLLNNKYRKEKLPKELQDIYNEEEYAKQQKYEKENTRFSLITSSFNFILIVGMLIIGGFAYVDEIAKSINLNPIVNALLFFGILYFASDILNTPFSIYNTFVIEEKFGFNKTTVKTYIFDKLKSWILTIILGGLIIGLIVWFYTVSGTLFWLYAWILITSFMIFMTMFYSNLIVPLFNKQTPLEEGELRNELEDFSKKVGFKLDNIYVINGSKRSTKSNAYFSGLGPKKRIVLYDTLINDLEPKEIVAVLAHEIGHYKLKHTLTGMILSVLQTGIMLYFLSLIINMPEISQALGVPRVSFHIGLIVFGILYSPISLVIGLGMNIVSRKNEFSADRFAKQHYDANKLIKALKKLTSKNLSNLMPHPLYVFFHYSHPTLYRRIKALK
ncbi:MAG: M48 family metallopeptidase [Chlorobi bacterium]|nr:M48 family metallopeptidase [Chlorobiota bacterium]